MVGGGGETCRPHYSFVPMRKELCVGCGLSYNYDPSDPKGATSVLCPSCQKRESRKKKRYDLLLIAGNGEVQCRCCGYRKFPYALNLLGVKDYLLSSPTDEDKARSSCLVCLNCKAAIDNGDIKYTVVNANCYPVEVNFYETQVTVVEQPIKEHLRRTDSSAIDMEVVHEKEKPGELRSVSRKIQRLEE